MRNPIALLRDRRWHRQMAALRSLPDDELHNLLLELSVSRARELAPADGLRFLLSFEADLYPEQGRLAVAYGGGVHPKHRHMRYHDFFVERIGPGEGVLDLGCGIGAVAYDIAERCQATVVGIDLSPSNIAIAQERFLHARVTYLIGDILRDVPNERFDVVVLSNVLEHLPQRSAFLDRVRKLTLARRFLIRVPMFERDWRVPVKQELGVEWRLDDTHEIEYTLAEFAEETAAAHLQVSELLVRWGEIWARLEPDVT